MLVERMRVLRERMLAAADKFRMDHGWEIDPDGWPARLYLRAYADNRASWLGVPAAAKAEIDREATERFPEVAAYVAMEERRRTLYGPDGDWRTHSDSECAEFMRWHAAIESAAGAVRDPWRTERYARWQMARAREVRERFDAARQSLCPFFWSVMIAVVFYLVLIPAKRAIGRALRGMGNAIAWLFNLVFGAWSRAIGRGALATCVFALFFLGTTYREKIGVGVVKATMGTFHTGARFVGWVASRPSAWTDTWYRWEQENLDEERIAWERHLAETESKIMLVEEARGEAERERRYRERREQWEREARERQLAWEREHPEEAAQRRADNARWQAIMDQERRAREAEQAQRAADAAFLVRINAIRDRVQFLEELPRKVARTLLIVLAVVLVIAAVVAVGTTFETWWGWLMTTCAFVLALCFIGLERFALGRGFLAVVDFLFRLPGIILGAVGVFFGGVLEGLALLLAFIVAVVRGACPMLIPIRKANRAEPA